MNIRLALPRNVPTAAWPFASKPSKKMGQIFLENTTWLGISKFTQNVLRHTNQNESWIRKGTHIFSQFFFSGSNWLLKAVRSYDVFGEVSSASIHPCVTVSSTHGMARHG